MRNFIFHVISLLILKVLWTPSFTARGFHLSLRTFALLDFDTQPCKAHSTAFIYARALLNDYVKCCIQFSQEPTFPLSEIRFQSFDDIPELDCSCTLHPIFFWSNSNFGRNWLFPRISNAILQDEWKSRKNSSSKSLAWDESTENNMKG